MLPILPWMPATELVLGLDDRDLKAAAERIAMKTQAMAKNLRDNAPVQRWEPLAIQFDHDGVRMTFESKSMVNHAGFTTTLSVINEICMRKNGERVIKIFESMAVTLDDYRNKTSLEKPSKTICLMEINLTHPIPEILTASLTLRPLQDIIELPPLFDARLGSRHIISATNTCFRIDISDVEDEAKSLHEKFQDSLPAF